MTTIEEMASMDVLCSDKTGTLTLNKLTLDKNLIKLMQGVRVLSFDIGKHEQHKLDNPSATAVTIPLDCLDDRNNSSDHVTPSSVTTVKDHYEKITPDKQKTSPVVACMTKGGMDSSVLQIALSQPNAKKEAGVGGTLEQDTLDRSANKPSSASQTDTS